MFRENYKIQNSHVMLSTAFKYFIIKLSNINNAGFSRTPVNPVRD